MINLDEFDHKTIRFNRKNAYILSQIAKLSYDDTINNSNIIERFDKEDTQAIALRNDNVLILGFRGTEPTKLADWTTDAKIIKEKTIYGEVHRGFLNAFNAIKPDILNIVELLSATNRSIWITGHSLGGALATLCATFLAKDYLINGVYTFGSPRVGDKDFVDTYNTILKKNTFRFVNNNDVVTRIPPRIFGYEHCGILKYFNINGNLYTDNELKWWNKFWDRIKGRLEDFGDFSPDGIGDHSIDNYIELCQKNLQKRVVK